MTSPPATAVFVIAPEKEQGSGQQVRQGAVGVQGAVRPGHLHLLDVEGVALGLPLLSPAGGEPRVLLGGWPRAEVALARPAVDAQRLVIIPPAPPGLPRHRAVLLLGDPPPHRPL